MQLTQQIDNHMESIIALASDDELALMRTMVIFDKPSFTNLPTRLVLRLWALDKHAEGLEYGFMLEKLYKDARRHLKGKISTEQ